MDFLKSTPWILKQSGQVIHLRSNGNVDWVFSATILCSFPYSFIEWSKTCYTFQALFREASHDSFEGYQSHRICRKCS